MLDEITKDSKARMEKSIESLKTELSKVRTGRAHPSILDHLKVSYYGSDTPLNQVANVAIEDSRTLLVTPFEKTMVAAVEKAIITSELGLNPCSAGTVIRIPMPVLTEERRKDLTKVVREEGEKSRISVRNIRREANTKIKELVKSKDISEDDERRGETEVQKITDAIVEEIEKIIVAKETELMAV